MLPKGGAGQPTCAQKVEAFVLWAQGHRRTSRTKAEPPGSTEQARR